MIFLSAPSARTYSSDHRTYGGISAELNIQRLQSPDEFGKNPSLITSLSLTPQIGATHENPTSKNLLNMKCSSLPIVGTGIAVVCLLASTAPLQADTEIVPGYNASITEILSPDELHLDPGSVVIAVDAFGNEDSEVNGVFFQTDRCDGCPDTEGEAINGGVTYRSISTHFIDNWSNAPFFTGGVGDSADNLAAIMEDIRWSAAPNAVTIELEGLVAGAAFEVQLLFNEGADRNRRWDIGVVDGDPEDIDEDGLIFDDIQSEGLSADSPLGDETLWTDENSFVATFTANANAEGKLTVVMQQHIGGQDPPGGDNNPILQAAIVHSVAAEDPLAVGLIGYWPLDGNLEDSRGDSHGEGMGGDPIEYAIGQFDQGVDLDGVDQFIQINEDNEETFDFTEGNGFTISAWFRVDDFTKSWQALAAKGEGNRWRIHRRGGESIMTGNGGNADVAAGTKDVNDGEIHHIVLVSTPDEGVVLYVDCEVEGESGPPNLENNDMPMMIGENPDARNRTWDGLIDDVAAWDRPLTEEEVKRIWEEGGNGKSIGDIIGGGGIEVVHGKEEILDEGGPDGWDLTVFVVDPLITSDDTAANGISDGTVTSWTAAFREDRADGEHTVAPVLAKRDTDSGDIIVVGVGDLVAPEQGEESITLPWGEGTGSNMIDLTEQNTEWLMGLYQGGPNGNNAGAVVPFAADGNFPMFAWDTADVPPEPDELVNAGHASHDAPAAREYQFNFTVTWGGGNNPDRDGDGLPNFYEEANGLNPDDPTDAASDGDNDGLTALQEFERRTDLTKADTDGDGLGDKVETGTGVWVSAEDTGTDARKADTDKDGIADGVETNTGVFVSKTDTGTNPHSSDSDGDGFGDNTEVNVCDSNPVDANSGCDELGLLAFWDFNDPSNPDQAVDLAAGIVADVDAAYTESGGGRTGEGGDYALSHVDGGTAHVPNADFLNLAGAVDLMSVSMWQKNTGTRNASSYWMLAEGFDRANQVHIPWSNNLIYFDTSGGCCAANSQRLQFDPSGQDGLEDWDWADEQWHHYVFVKNGETKQVWIDGIFAFETPDADPLPEEGWTDLFIGSAANGGNSADGCVDDFAVYALALTEEAIVALANGESPIGGSKLPFQITNIVRDANGVTLTWASRSSSEYSVEYVETLSDPNWIELDDGVEGQDGETSFEDDDAARTGRPGGWYRIREN